MAEDGRRGDLRRDQGVVGSKDLDISHDERVVRLDKQRFVISTGENRPRKPEDETPEENSNGEPTSDDEPVSDDEPEENTPSIVLPKDPRKRAILARKLLAERVGAVQSEYAFAITALVDGTVTQHEAVSDEVTDVFRSLVQWYAETVSDGETPTDEVLGILLLASEVQVTYPGRAIEALANSHGLDRTDSIGELLDSVERSGASFPPNRTR
ncbi:hypothetical protein ACFQJC_10590 [Haloferax namakaokahaiae]|uniref:Uncharacterized protein n=1 Tax=Haloferax namakaokahaiae TaxID=1748331 RepID=A0ABD5ZFB4_9EURY